MDSRWLGVGICNACSRNNHRECLQEVFQTRGNEIMTRLIPVLIVGAVFLILSPQELQASCSYQDLSACEREKGSCYERANHAMSFFSTVGTVQCVTVSLIPVGGAAPGVVCTIVYAIGYSYNNSRMRARCRASYQSCKRRAGCG